jgi:hypothetical protein
VFAATLGDRWSFRSSQADHSNSCEVAMSIADIIALLMDLAEQYPFLADIINQVITILQGLGG